MLLDFATIGKYVNCRKILTMKKTLSILLMCQFLFSCDSNNNDEVASPVTDYSIAPNEIKGDWKVDYFELKNYPGIIQNTTGQYFKVSNDSKVSYKDYYIGMTNEKANYTGPIDYRTISLVQNQIIMEMKPSSVKPGYTEIKVSYNGSAEKNNTLFAKKQ